ncbi:hypothetical protein CH286_10060 [Rhodococcus sp. WWJCD1]|nr:hypothetical protein CH286_10060 [Rhodococcus sp. WWJCD1]
MYVFYVGMPEAIGIGLPVKKGTASVSAGESPQHRQGAFVLQLLASATCHLLFRAPRVNTGSALERRRFRRQRPGLL